MRTIKEVDSGTVKRRIVSLNVASSGDGKTYNAGTYPKSAWIITEPAGLETVLNNPCLKKNIVGFEYFIPDPSDEERTLKAMYGDIATSTIVKEILTYKEMAKKGEVETLVIDNLTYLVHNRWMYQCKFEQQYSKQGELNKMAMFGNLRDWCYNFVLMYVVNFPANVVVNVHEMKESEEAMDNKIDKTIDKVPNLMGGFRNDIFGLFSNVFFLSKNSDGKGGYKYSAQTNKGGGRHGKNRYNLPTVIENVSYETIKKAIDDSMAKVEPKKEVK